MGTPLYTSCHQKDLRHSPPHSSSTIFQPRRETCQVLAKAIQPLIKAFKSELEACSLVRWHSLAFGKGLALTNKQVLRQFPAKARPVQILALQKFRRSRFSAAVPAALAPPLARLLPTINRHHLRNPNRKPKIARAICHPPRDPSEPVHRRLVTPRHRPPCPS